MHKHFYHIILSIVVGTSILQATPVTPEHIRQNTPRLMQAIDKADLESFMGLFDLTCVYDAENTRVPGLIDAYTAMLQKLEIRASTHRQQLQQEWQKYPIRLLTFTKGLGQCVGGLYLTGMAPMYAGWHHVSGNQITQKIVRPITRFLQPRYLQKPYEVVLTMPTKYAIPALTATTVAGVYSIQNGIKNMIIGFYYREYLEQKLQDLQAMLNRIEKAKVLLEITTGQYNDDQDDDITDYIPA
ncbi:MAG TPA: hypothetical protein PLU71_01500 [Candidatus Dependentiae bacterium]|nr:hypothetical protein [Candidatus Dependentiae bacterium]HRQ62507.1 hypothetical protein [Candidatus Dependentiae bacterium]